MLNRWQGGPATRTLDSVEPGRSARSVALAQMNFSGVESASFAIVFDVI